MDGCHMIGVWSITHAGLSSREQIEGSFISKDSMKRKIGVHISFSLDFACPAS